MLANTLAQVDSLKHFQQLWNASLSVTFLKADLWLRMLSCFWSLFDKEGVKTRVRVRLLLLLNWLEFGSVFVLFVNSDCMCPSEHGLNI